MFVDPSTLITKVKEEIIENKDTSNEKDNNTSTTTTEQKSDSINFSDNRTSLFSSKKKFF